MHSKGKLIFILFFQLIAGIIQSSPIRNPADDALSQSLFSFISNPAIGMKVPFFQTPSTTSWMDENDDFDYEPVPPEFDNNLAGNVRKNHSVFFSYPPYQVFASSLEKNRFLTSISDLPPPLS